MTFHTTHTTTRSNIKSVLRCALGLLFGLPFLTQGQTQTTNFTTTGSWTCPPGVTSITVECWGGGGAGAAVGGNPAAGGGGAGGAYARKVLTVVPGTVYTVTVATSKTSGAKTVAASANDGNPTWFGNTSTVYASGGPGAAGGGDTNSFNGTGATGTTTGSIGDVVFAGGNGANGASTSGAAGGAGGGAAGTAANGGNASAGTGGVGGSGNPGTGTGATGPANNVAGAAGATYGGGGAGGKANTTTDRAGGTGAAGYLRITYQNNAPINFAAAVASSTTINLNWTDNSSNETGFEIWASATSGGTYTLLNTTAANATSYIHSGLAANSPHYYKIKAVNSGNTAINSTFSSEVNGTTYDATQQAISDWTFQYKYDARKRMIAKKVPGADWVYMVYDNRDRLVLTQDGNQRRAANGAYKNQWTFTKYDQLNRPVITGIYTHDSYKTQAEMNALISTTNFFDTYDGSGTFHGYTNNVFPQNNLDVLTVTYYDNYSFKTLWGGTAYDYTNESLTATVINGTYTEPTTENTRVLGHPTGSKTKVLDAAGTNYIKAVTYYDDKYRAIQVITDAYLNGAVAGTDRTTSLYDFPGKVLKTMTKHNIVSGTPSKTITRRMEYDHAGRLLETYHLIGTNPADEVLLSKNNYNELGQLVDKQLHATNADNYTTFKQSVDHRYNIRGWLTSINNSALSNDAATTNTNDDTNDLFGMNLLYEQTDAALGSTGLYNGNISGMKWSANLGQATEKERGYAFSYDAMNRLLSASHKTKTATWAASNSYHEDGFQYDLNGNIKNLNRKGASASNMDALTYAYSGNQLLTVTDAGDKTKGFVEPASTTGNDYTYDVNGNMTVDQNKGITAITYNHLNLPAQVTKNTNEYIKYIYDATGRKLRQEVYNASNVLQKSTDYAGEFIYENNALQFINHEEGRILPAGNEYQYHLKDHLGNVRLTFTTKQETTNETATYETANANTEQSQFVRYNTARLVNSVIFDKTNGNSTGYAERLNGSTDEKFGVGKSLSVMPGDVINAEVYAKYVDASTSNWTTAFNTLMGQIAGNTPGVVMDGSAYPGNTSSFPFPTPASQNTSGSTGTGPKAYLNWLVFDRNYNFILGKSGYYRIASHGIDPKENGQDVAHERLFSPAITIDQPGYVYIFLSNEEPTGSPVEVYFDDFKVTYTKSPVVQQDDYYPFGLTFNSYKRENSTNNNYLFNNGSELQPDLGMNLYSTLFRLYDPALGRFVQIDPLADFMPAINPYQFGFNNPVLHNDPFGLSPNPPTLWQRIKVFFGIGRWGGTKQAGNLVYVPPVGRSRSKNPIPVVPRATAKVAPPKAEEPKPQVEEIPDIDIEPDEPEPILTYSVGTPLKRSPKPNPTTTPEKKKHILEGTDLNSDFKITGKIFFEEGTEEIVGGEGTLMRYLSPLASYMAENPTVFVQITVTTPLTDKQKMRNNNRPVTDVMTGRLDAVKKALQKLGVPEHHAWVVPGYNVPGSQHAIIEKK